MAIVTGGSQGIGKSTALKLAQAGANVVILSRSPQKLQSALDEMEKFRQHPKQVLEYEAVDATDFSATQDTLHRVLHKFGAPDLVVNSAGVAHPGYIDELAMEKFTEMMNINFFTVANICKALVPAMKKAGGGHIVNVSSVAGYVGLFAYTGYCGSKYAVMGFSEALGVELKPFNIQVSVLCPPNTRTPGLDEENKTKPSEVLKIEEKVKVVEPEFVADALLKGVIRKKKMIIPTFDSTVLWYLQRYVPKIAGLFVKRPDIKL